MYLHACMVCMVCIYYIPQLVSLWNIIVRDTAIILIILIAPCLLLYCIVLIPSQSLSCTFFCSGLILSPLCTCQQESGDTLMIEAALQGQSEIVEQLIRAGANVDSTRKVMYYTGKRSLLFYLRCRYTYFVCMQLIVIFWNDSIG